MRGRTGLLALGLGLLVVAACSGDDDTGGGRTADGEPVTQGTAGPDPAPAARTPWGAFPEGVLSVTPPDGDALFVWCVLVAETAQQRAVGLMDAPGPDLGGYDGMVFTWDEPVTGGFWMKDTEVPLSIAWIDADGGVVSSADMDPCPAGSTDCPSYRAAGPYRMALEAPQGRLDELGVELGARLQLDRRSCPSA